MSHIGWLRAKYPASRCFRHPYDINVLGMHLSSWALQVGREPWGGRTAGAPAPGPNGKSAVSSFCKVRCAIFSFGGLFGQVKEGMCRLCKNTTGNIVTLKNGFLFQDTAEPLPSPAVPLFSLNRFPLMAMFPPWKTAPATIPSKKHSWRKTFTISSSLE